MKLTTVLAAAAASALFAASGSYAQDKDQTSAQDKEQTQQKSQKAQASGQKESRGDARHMRDMAQANMAEIEAGKLALQKAQSDEVKKYAQQMVDDHTKMLDEMKQLAQAKGVDLPTAPDRKHQRLMKKLESASGEDFDRAYMSAMVRDHRDALKVAQRTAKSAKDSELKSSAQKAAPEIQDHLKMAQEIEKTEKSEKRSASGKTGKTSEGSQAGGAAR